MSVSLLVCCREVGCILRLIIKIFQEHCSLPFMCNAAPFATRSRVPSTIHLFSTNDYYEGGLALYSRAEYVIFSCSPCWKFVASAEGGENTYNDLHLCLGDT